MLWRSLTSPSNGGTVVAFVGSGRSDLMGDVMPRQKKTVPALLGRWRITDMEMWDTEYIDMEVRAFIEFEPDRMGHFQFGLVRGYMDCHPTERDGRPAVEWSWEGNDECDPAMGRGWAVLETEKTLVGRIFIHQGDSSSFRAKRDSTRKRTTTARRGSGSRSPRLTIAPRNKGASKRS